MPAKAKAKPATPSRKVKTGAYRSFKLNKRVKNAKPLPGSFRLFRSSLRHLKKHWRLFGGLVAIYLVLTIVLVKGFGISEGVGELKDTLEQVFTGATGELATGATLFALMLTSVGSTSTSIAGLYQTILLVIVSLALIWGLRQSYAAKKVLAKEAMYKGMLPLVPFILVLGVIGLQLLPIFIASWLHGVVIAGGIAVTAPEQAIAWVMIGLLAMLSLYMLSSSIFALYIVTLPDMTPLKALRSAREIVRYRRWTVLRKVLVLPLMLLLLGALIMLPLIIFVTPVAEWAFFILNMTVLAVFHSYLYGLYRELL